jgi:protoheme IX farnesyltransferase
MKQLCDMETLTPPARPVAGAALAISRVRVADYLELTKPRIASLVLITTIVGFVLGSHGVVDGWGLLHVVLGTALAAAGANALNQWMEREHDARMSRTASRPLPAGRLGVLDALAFGIVVSVAGIAYLLAFSHPLAAATAIASLISYLLMYTPLKRRTPWCTVVGAFPGALPPVIGYVAASGTLDVQVLLLFLILFVWQIPHFWAIGWMYRRDYRRAGYPILPVVDADGRRTGRQVVLLCALMLPLGAAPYWFGLAGGVYLFGAAVLGALFFALGVRFAQSKTRASARRLMLASVAYLPLLLGLLILNP